MITITIQLDGSISHNIHNDYDVVKYTEQRHLKHSYNSVCDFVEKKLVSEDSLLFGIFFSKIHAFLAANSYVEDIFLVTTSFTTYLTRPVSNGKIKSYGKVVNMNNTQFITESVLFNEQKKEIGRGSGIFVKSKFPLSKAMGYLNQ